MRADLTPKPIQPGWDLALHWSGRIWFILAAVGQLAFILFIVAFYGTRTLSGNWAGWNDKELITGHVEGDGFGNLMFAAHVLIAAIVTLGGLLQLLPHVRAKFPAVHRWNGRLFLGMACFLALGGMWMGMGMGIGRGSYLSIVSALAVWLNGVLILGFSALTLRYALRRDFVRHQNWAVRTFMVVSGVWFFRIGLMGWIIINQGPRGMTATLSGPADILIAFGSYLIPLLGYELYRFAKGSSAKYVKGIWLLCVSVLSLFMVIGIFGTIAFMWMPVI